ncbi:hypothetical protein F4808DRAFT_61632 [Astrocystis sublimbata]|nr:hypothetical protein F4808DRAFT_61632 [Astrocystis sublimbata]
MAENLNSAPRKRQRHRAAKSCEPCRSRKIKCDRGLPCRPCLRSRASLLCNYKPDTPASPKSLQGHTPTQRENEQEADVLSGTPATYRSEEVPNPLEPLSIVSEGQEPPASSLSQRISVLENLFKQSGHESCRNTSSKDLEARISRIEQRINTSASQPNAPDKSELRVKLPCPHLRPEHEKTRLFGKSHWIHSLDQFNILSQMQSKPYSVVDGVQGQANGGMLEAANARRRAKTRGVKLLHEPMPGLRESIPSKEVCDEAIDGYLRTFEPMFRILHLPTFLKEYDAFWTRAEPAETEFLMKLIMVLTIGGIFLPDRSIANDIKRTARNWVYAVQWWLMGPTERDAMSIDGIQVFCLLLLARQTNALGGTASVMTEALSKLSFTIGLHIDPRYHLSITPFESELRRRLWLTVLELTAITSLNSTLPLLLVPGDYHVPLPSNIADSELGTPIGTTTSGIETERAQQDQGSNNNRNKYGNIDCSVQLLLAKSLRLRTQIIRELNDSSREASYDKAIAQSRSLQAYCRELAAALQTTSTSHSLLTNQNPDKGNRNKSASTFHHKFLDTYLRRLILFLHRPFAHKARRDHRFLLSRKMCLESSLVMAAHAEAMDLSARSEDREPVVAVADDYAYSCISGGGMFKGAMSQDVIITVSLEIVTQLEEMQELAQLEGQVQSNLQEQQRQQQPQREGSAPLPQATPKPKDPLSALHHSHRAPLLRYLAHAQAQWREVIRLGRPSLKQYLFVSCMLDYIAALESQSTDSYQHKTQPPREAKAAMLETVKRVVRECTVMLRESDAYRVGSGNENGNGNGNPDDVGGGWFGGGGGGGSEVPLDELDFGGFDTMALFGFDFNALNPTFELDMPGWVDMELDMSGTGDVQNFI